MLMTGNKDDCFEIATRVGKQGEKISRNFRVSQDLHRGSLWVN